MTKITQNTENFLFILHYLQYSWNFYGPTSRKHNTMLVLLIQSIYFSDFYFEGMQVLHLTWMLVKVRGHLP